jgi:hypothetical protein
MFVKIKGHVVNLANVTHIEHDDGDIAVWFTNGKYIHIFGVKWRKLYRRLKQKGFPSLLPSTSKK